MSSEKHIKIGPDHTLSLEEIHNVAHNPTLTVGLSRDSKTKVQKSRRTVEKMVAKNEIVYGVTTGFGNFKDKIISERDVERLQRNLIRSHSVGVGDLLTHEQVRATMLVRLNSLAQGFSGVRLELLELICSFLNKNIIPLVPSQGSVGASGDLAPLSHIALALMGEGYVFYEGRKMKAETAFRKTKLHPTVFSIKEGLAFTNGTAMMAGISALLLHESESLMDIADLGCAMTLEAVHGTGKAFNTSIHNLRPHPGQKTSAKNIRRFIKSSRLVNSARDRVQDSYSLRCTAQVHGAIRDAVSYARSVIECEVNSVTDNPLIFSDTDKAISGGNFHGEPIAIAMDTFAIAISELGNISERRIAKLVDPATNHGLPPFLIPEDIGGLHNGLMITQYTAAALVSENKILAHPASADSIPTSANQEDHVSMGSIATIKAVQVLKNTENVLAIEFLSSAQAIDFRESEKLGEVTGKAHRTIRKSIPTLLKDRVLADDITSMRSLIPSIKSVIDSK